jgi:hypothetical protein
VLTLSLHKNQRIVIFLSQTILYLFCNRKGKIHWNGVVNHSTIP